jgi:hypothetical protein
MTKETFKSTFLEGTVAFVDHPAIEEECILACTDALSLPHYDLVARWYEDGSHEMF